MTSILVVDADAIHRAFVRDALQAHGHRIVEAASGDEAIACFERDQPECVLCEVRQPRIDGPAVCRRIRTLSGGALVSFMFMTADHDVDSFDLALAAGGDDFLTKPASAEELLARVDGLLNLRRLATERNELYGDIKRQRDALQRLQLQKQQLISFLVHDLKNPIHAIDLLAQLVQRDDNAGARARDVAGKIRDDGHAQLRMISSMLDVIAADEGRLAPARAWFDLGALVGEVIGLMSAQAVAAQVDLGGDRSALFVHADPALIRRVLENLVDNSIRQSPSGAQVRVTTTSVAQAIEVRVVDRGAGVVADQRLRVFERYQTCAQTTSNRGLGLAFCKLAIEAHDGRIWIEDSSPGASFCISLPQAGAAVHTRNARVAAARPHHRAVAPASLFARVAS